MNGAEYIFSVVTMMLKEFKEELKLKFKKIAEEKMNSY